MSDNKLIDTISVDSDDIVQTHHFRVPPEIKGDRLDKVLAQLMPEHSRGRIQGWINDGLVMVNNKVAKVRHVTGPDDLIVVNEPPSPESLAFTAEPIDFEVIADSPEWIVVNKPAGLVTHPGAGNWHGTLLNGLLYRYPELSRVARAGIVHRLDKDTSGLMVVARNETAQTNLVRQLQSRTVGRKYLAIAHGICPATGTFDKPIGRDAHAPVKMSIKRPIAAKEAITHFQRLDSALIDGKGLSLVRCKLETGRTHQIRVHLSAGGYPLLGDTLYGGQLQLGATRQMLHAQMLEFNDPQTNNVCSFECAIPSDMQLIIDAIPWTK